MASPPDTKQESESDQLISRPQGRWLNSYLFLLNSNFGFGILTHLYSTQNYLTFTIIVVVRMPQFTEIPIFICFSHENMNKLHAKVVDFRKICPNRPILNIYLFNLVFMYLGKASHKFMEEILRPCDKFDTWQGF